MSDDLQRSLGRVEGAQKAMEDRLSKLEDAVSEGFHEVTEALKGITNRLDGMEATESERKGAWKVIVTVAGAVSGFIAWASQYFFR